MALLISGYAMYWPHESSNRPQDPWEGDTERCIEKYCTGCFAMFLAGRPEIPILLNHEQGSRIGGTETGEVTIKENCKGLRVELVIPNSGDAHNRAMDAGIPWALRGWSISFAGQNVDKGRECGLPSRKIVRARLNEISVVTAPTTPALACDIDFIEISEPEAICRLSVNRDMHEGEYNTTLNKRRIAIARHGGAVVSEHVFAELMN